MRYLFFIIILCFPFLLKAQTGYRLIYNLKYQIDSTDINSVSDELFYLDMFGNESYFLSENKFLLDSFLVNVDEGADVNVLASMSKRPKIPTFGYILQNKNDTVRHYERVLTTKIMYQEKVNLSWKLSEDTLQIGNYICQKATTHFAGRDYEAWYTTEIPLTAAPYKFNGILGVVMRVVDSKKHYQFNLLEIKSTEKSLIYELINEQKIIDKKDFLIVKEKMKSNPEVMFTEFGFQLTEEAREAMRKKTEARLKRENNPIELE